MKSIRKLTIALPNRDDYYLNIAFGMMKAFAQRGVECLIADDASEPASFGRHLKENRPDAVFEINRTRNQSGNVIPKEIPHIAWLQDTRNRGRLHCADPEFGGSEIVYTLLHPENFGLHPGDHPSVKWSVLQTGVDPEIFQPDPNARIAREFAFCGYLPPLIPDGFGDDVPFVSANGKSLSLGEMRHCLLIEHQTGVGKLNLPDVHRIILDRINALFGTDLTMLQFLELFGQPDSFGGAPLLLYLDTELPRIPERLRLLNAAISQGQLEIFGPPTWRFWPNFSPYYQRMLLWRSELAEVYRTSRINLHNGAFGMHSRVLECMACGGVIAVNATDFDDRGQDISANFEAGKHYIRYDFDDVESVLANTAANQQQCIEMGRAAAKAISDGHLWSHRVDTILSDIAAL